MNYACPLCGADLAGRKLAGTVIARMDVDCPHCKGPLVVNVHAAESLVVLGTVAVCVALASLAYAWQSQGLLLAALAGAMSGAGVVHALERTWLRAWPRYAARVPPARME